jgi:hypothetical protein
MPTHRLALLVANGSHSLLARHHDARQAHILHAARPDAEQKSGGTTSVCVCTTSHTASVACRMHFVHMNDWIVLSCTHNNLLCVAWIIKVFVCAGCGVVCGGRRVPKFFEACVSTREKSLYFTLKCCCLSSTVTNILIILSTHTYMYKFSCLSPVYLYTSKNLGVPPLVVRREERLPVLQDVPNKRGD